MIDLEKIDAFIENKLIAILDSYSSSFFKSKAYGSKDRIDLNSVELTDFARYESDEDVFFLQDVTSVAAALSYYEVPTNDSCSSLDLVGRFLKLFQENKDKSCRLFSLYAFMFDRCGDSNLLHKVSLSYREFFETKNPFDHIIKEYFLPVRKQYYSNIAQDDFKGVLKKLANDFLEAIQKDLSTLGAIFDEVKKLVCGNYSFSCEEEFDEVSFSIYSPSMLVM